MSHVLSALMKLLIRVYLVIHSFYLPLIYLFTRRRLGFLFFFWRRLGRLVLGGRGGGRGLLSQLPEARLLHQLLNLLVVQQLEAVNGARR